MSTRLESQEEARQRLASEALSDVERARLWQRIAASEAHKRSQRARRRAVLLATVLGPPAAVAALLFVVRLEMTEQVAHHDPCTLDARHKKLALGAGCEAAQRVPIEGDLWELSPGAEVERTKTGAHVRQGRVSFKVRPRIQAAPFRVRVSAGEIRVIGTELEVVQSTDGRGSLSVREGVVELLWSDGLRERVAAGERVEWPRVARSAPAKPAQAPVAPIEAPVAAPSANASALAAKPDAGPRPQGAPPGALDMDHVMERLLQLKSQARNAEAVELLSATLRARGLSGVQRERISYELGLSLEASGKAACAHWQAHEKRFGVARFQATLEQRLRACK